LIVQQFWQRAARGEISGKVLNCSRQRTDELGVLPYAAIGEDACAELGSTVRATSTLMAAALWFAR
jgi:hypothetical protein